MIFDEVNISVSAAQACLPLLKCPSSTASLSWSLCAKSHDERSRSCMKGMYLETCLNCVGQSPKSLRRHAHRSKLSVFCGTKVTMIKPPDWPEKQLPTDSTSKATRSLIKVVESSLHRLKVGNIFPITQSFPMSCLIADSTDTTSLVNWQRLEDRP